MVAHASESTMRRTRPARPKTQEFHHSSSHSRIARLGHHASLPRHAPRDRRAPAEPAITGLTRAGGALNGCPPLACTLKRRLHMHVHTPHAPARLLECRDYPPSPSGRPVPHETHPDPARDPARLLPLDCSRTSGAKRVSAQDALRGCHHTAASRRHPPRDRTSGLALSECALLSHPA